MAKRVATPGVYVVEKTSFGKSAVALPTAIPAFVGYTEKAVKDGKSLINKPTRITSLADFENLFGGNAKHLFQLETATGDEFDIEVNGVRYELKTTGARFMLYDSLRYYFANGGGVAYIVSAGTFKKADGEANSVSKVALLTALQSLETQPEPTILGIPDVANVSADAAVSIQQQMLAQCANLQNRFSVLDVPNGFKTRTLTDDDVVTVFREKIGDNALAYGAAYYPWVNTSVVDVEELCFENIQNPDALIEVLSNEAETANANSRKVDDIKTELGKITDDAADKDKLHKTLKAVCPSYKTVLSRMATKLNLLPPSGGVIGLYARVDDSRGIWKAPANEALNATVSPVVQLSNEDQEDLNVTVNGKSVNAIRNFAGAGTLVWGARTLDGNSEDWKYVNVRRTLTYIEQSVKNAARAYVFEPNKPSTWVSIKASVSGFLTGLWQQGGLAGGSTGEAYEVLVGLNSSMTPEDILEGMLRVTVKVALLRPAEFIEVTFEQKMQVS